VLPTTRSSPSSAWGWGFGDEQVSSCAPHHAELSVFGLGLWGFGDEQVSSCAPHHAELSVFGLGLWGFGDEQVSSCAPLNRAT
jgi:hypothetical protein